MGVRKQHFEITDGSAAGNIRLTIAHDTGRVGIGTTSPDTKLQVVGDFKVGDDNTNYMEVEADGDALFVGGGGLQYGEISVIGGAVNTTLNSTGGKVQITTFTTGTLPIEFNPFFRSAFVFGLAEMTEVYFTSVPIL